MRKDPIVDEARRAGREYIASFKGDWNALIADLNRRHTRLHLVQAILLLRLDFFEASALAA